VSEANDRDVVDDLADVSFFDATRAGVLLYARRRLDAAERKRLIARPSRCVTRVIELIRVDALFDKCG